MDLITLHRRAGENWQRTLEAVQADQWDDPTPCREWNVRQLVNHIVNEDLWTVPLLEGKTIADVGDQFDGDVLGDDPVAKSSVTWAEAAAAVDKHLPEGGMVSVSWGQIPAEEYVRQLFADHLIHAWDLAAATGQSRDLDPELVVEVAAWFAPNEDMIRSAGVIAERPDLGGDPQTELLAGYGRRADWSA
ncbi:MAG TPA: TIGR03086 family metal-binding protein [Nocardioidaceae bacterium]|nr:TIGR03086 family metal-binding protein [Nocardioidaceae bacterium]